MNVTSQAAGIARRAALQLRSAYGEELPTAVDEIITPTDERAEIYDLGTLIAVASLIVASAQLLLQIRDEFKSKKQSQAPDPAAMQIRIEASLRKEYPDETAIVADVTTIVTQVLDSKD